MDFSPPAATMYREIGGLSSMIDRLKLEVEAVPQGADTSAEAMQTDAAGPSAAAASTSAGAALMCSSWAWRRTS